MSIKDVVKKQYQQIVNKTATHGRQLAMPAEGWLVTVRKALGMSAATLARRMGKSRALVSQTEKAELAGGVTLTTMTTMAKAMNCKFVYAIVPDDTIEGILYQQALKKATQTVKRSSTHMALEDQILTKDQMDLEIERLARDLLRDMPSDFWTL
ncbi:mobile mystery protein A [Paremcibacter congregatus]|uniref:mobile mystery protein A n=1 Tax=Paremcibacter congregatus TaxID=2043170 RepID=UPI0030EC060D|tara:strand:+ start:824 stop:1285 length:462 start_codon:yes stop_codon:yes gene_type:complete